MKVPRIFLVLALTVTLVSCGKIVSTLETNDYALDLARLESRGLLKETEQKSDFMGELFQPFIKNTFRVGGYNHRLREIQSNWKVFEDSGFVIFCGSVAKTDNDIYAFVWVLADKSQGKYETVFLQIGKEVEEGSEYPASIVPRKLNNEQADALSSRSATLHESE